MLVLSALVFFLLYVYSFRSQFSVVGGILFTKSPPLQCALAWRECTTERRGSSCHIENEFYCFLSGFFEALTIREGISSLFLKRVSQGRTHRYPMNCSIGLIFLVKMAYQHHDQFGDAGFQSVSFELVTSGNVIPLPFSNRKKLDVVAHQIRLRFRL